MEKRYQTNAWRFPSEKNESLYCLLCPVVVFLSPSSMKAAPAILAAPLVILDRKIVDYCWLSRPPKELCFWEIYIFQSAWESYNETKDATIDPKELSFPFCISMKKTCHWRIDEISACLLSTHLRFCLLLSHRPASLWLRLHIRCEYTRRLQIHTDSTSLLMTQLKIQHSSWITMLVHKCILQSTSHVLSLGCTFCL